MVSVKRRSGFSLLEILVAMLLFMIVFAAFAMVFPAGFHLNLKSYRTNKSIDLADAILQEIVNKPVYAPTGDALAGDSLYNLCGCSGSGWASVASGPQTATTWTPTALTDFQTNNPELAKLYDYTLPDGTGIEVTFLSGGGLTPPISDNPLIEITVNLVWRDLNNAGGIVGRQVTVTTFVTANRPHI